MSKPTKKQQLTTKTRRLATLDESAGIGLSITHRMRADVATLKDYKLVKPDKLRRIEKLITDVRDALSEISTIANSD